MTEVNKKLLRETLQYIKDHPDEWKQSEWHCGSAGCFAWRAGSLAQATPVVQGDMLPVWQATGYYESLERYIEDRRWIGTEEAERRGLQLVENRDSFVVPPGLTAEEKVEIFDFARAELGLKQEDSDALFAGHNTLEDLEAMVRILCDYGTLAGTIYGSGGCHECGGWHQAEDCPELEEDEEEDEPCTCRFCV